jgi:hypothetical protein
MRNHANKGIYKVVATRQRKADSIWVTTQNLPISFSPDNKNTKDDLPLNCANGKPFSESDLSASINQLAVKPRTVHNWCRRFGQAAQYGRVHPRKP